VATRPEVRQDFGERGENEVATRILRGDSNRVIAGALYLTEHDYIKSIFDKPACVAAASSPAGCWPHSGRGEPLSRPYQGLSAGEDVGGDGDHYASEGAAEELNPRRCRSG
jgi:hypothetical protein